MKYLKDFTEDKLSAVFKMYGCFFAFSNEQLKEQAKPLVKYVQLPSGLICPHYHAASVVKAINKAMAEGIAEDVEAHGIKAVIQRELNNHEAYYLGSIEDTVEALSGYASYGVTVDVIRQVFYRGGTCDS